MINMQPVEHAVYMANHEIIEISNAISHLRSSSIEVNFLENWAYGSIDFIKGLHKQLSNMSKKGVNKARIVKLLHRMDDGLTGCLVYPGPPPNHSHTHTTACWKIHEHLLPLRGYIMLAVDALMGILKQQDVFEYPKPANQRK